MYNKPATIVQGTVATNAAPNVVGATNILAGIAATRFRVTRAFFWVATSVAAGMQYFVQVDDTALQAGGINGGGGIPTYLWWDFPGVSFGNANPIRLVYEASIGALIINYSVHYYVDTT